MKQCSKCGSKKEYFDFPACKGTKDGYSSRCKSCRSDYAKKYRKTENAKNKERAAKNNRISNLRNLVADPTIVLSPIESYILGFIQTDGSFSGDSIQIEISIKDIDILFKIKQNLNLNGNISTRIRDTNFKKNAESATLSINKSIFLDKIKCLVPVGKKSQLIEAPKNISYSERDYWRGVIDGDGSLGIKKSNGNVFISLNTSSDKLYNDYISYLNKNINFIPKVSRNKRDNTYNIVLLNINCISLVKLLYSNNDISLYRKQELANKIIIYDLYSIPTSFSKEEDRIIFSHSNEESSRLLPKYRPSNLSLRRNYLLNLERWGYYNE